MLGKAGEKGWKIGYGDGEESGAKVQTTVQLVADPGCMDGVCARCGCVCRVLTDYGDTW